MGTTNRAQLTVLSRIREDHTGNLYAALEDFRTCLGACGRAGPASGAGGACPVCALPGLHSFRWVVLPKQFGEQGKPVQQESLVLWTVFDGALDDHLGSLCGGSMKQHLDRVYEHCEGFPARPTSREIEKYLRDGQVPNPVFFDGLPGWTRQVVEDERRLWEYVDALVSDGVQGTARDPAAVHRALRDAVRANDSFTETLSRPLQRHADPVTPDGSLGAELQTLVANALALGIDWVLRLFAPDDPQAARAKQADWPQDQYLKRTDEEGSGVNPATILWEVKRDCVHQSVLSFVLWMLRVRDIPNNRDGRVAGVDIVHAVQWCIVDEPPRLLFFANYDGTWEDYFDAFSATAAERLNAIWGNTIGFPPTTGISKGGAFDIDRFRAATRMHQIPTTVWHSALSRDLTLARIRRNARLRDGLLADLTPEQAKEWAVKALS